MGLESAQLIIVLANKNKISCIKSGNNVSILCLRPYHIESTSSRPITEVNQCRGLISTWMGDRLGIPAAVHSLHGIRINPAYYCACK